MLGELPPLGGSPPPAEVTVRVKLSEAESVVAESALTVMS